ncbi:serine/arginine-rich splicing factor SC35-like isoform X3 [Papaver somniferum]|uniref:serine/arginine-rich splicing factor SC35-like isoform X3 n=1 Tax=Papaver somniferum TaxID=3469 RepID=UPI000E6F806A|nr:serine/arginine-rich splicing factor SC35-like isoform X3 [Papaver somniferum]
MSHFGRSGPPDIRDTYSLLVLNITFRTTADDLFPLFDKYGKVVDIFIPRDRRTGDSRGFAFVRYKYPDEASKAVEKLDGRNVDGRDIMVQFAKYGPNAERISKGRVSEPVAKTRGSRERSRSRSPRRRSRDEHRGRDSRRRSRSRSRERYDDRSRGRGRDSRHRSRTRSLTPDYRKGGSRSRYEEERRRSRSKSAGSASPVRRSPSPRKRSLSPRRTPPRGESPDRRSHESPRKRSPSPIPRSVSPQREPARSRSPSQQNSDADD